jgi:hypothetical protein
MGDGACLGAGAVVHLVVGGERRVDHIADEQMQHAPAAARPPEEALRVHQRPCVPVHMDRQPGVGAEHLPHRHLAPAQHRMLDDGPGVPVHPAARGEADTERPAARRRVQQRGEPVGGAGQDAVRIRGTPVLQLPFGDDPSAQIEQRHRGVRHRHVHPAHHEPRVVHVEGYVRPADAVGPPGCGGLPDEPELGETGAVVGHRRR